MKKFLVVILAVCLAAMMGMVAFAADNTVTNFDAADIDAYMNYNTGLSMYGITPPVLTKTADGVQVACDDGAQVQSFLIGDEATVAAIKAFALGGNQYLRVAIETGTANASVRLTFNDAANGQISFDCANAKLIAKDGTETSFTTADGGGMGENTSIVVPANFDGYVFFALADLNKPAPAAWQRPDFDANNMTGGNFEIDVRQAQGSTYVLKSIVATDSTAVDAGQQGGDEPIQGTADISTIAFAAAAVVGSGALIIRKKR